MEPAAVARHRQPWSRRRPGPQARASHDHRRLGHDAVADGRRRRDGAGTRLEDRGRGALQRERRGLAERDARATARRRTRPRSRSTPTSTSTRPTQQQLQYAKKGVRAGPRRSRPSRSRAPARPPAAPPAPPRNLPTYAARTAPRAGQQQLQATRRHDRTTASTRPSQTHQGRPRRGQQADVACWSTSTVKLAPRRPRRAPTARSPAAAGIDKPSAATRSPSARSRSPSRRGRQARRPADPARLRRPLKYVGHRPRRAPVPVLRDAPPAPPRAARRCRRAVVADASSSSPAAAAADARGAHACVRRRPSPQGRPAPRGRRQLVHDEPERVAQHLRAVDHRGRR